MIDTVGVTEPYHHFMIPLLVSLKLCFNECESDCSKINGVAFFAIVLR